MSPSQTVGTSQARSKALADADKPEVRRSIRLLFGFLIFLSAFLLFQVQLIIAKYVLPWFGGAAAVWTTCMLAFQVLLLVGYWYAHGTRSLGHRQPYVHAALLLASVAVLAILAGLWTTPITPGDAFKPTGAGNPVGGILRVLAATVALPFFLLSTTTPLLQEWYQRGGGGDSVYRLYALSNAGSLLGLLTYPFVLEPLTTLRTQAWLWTLGYAVFACTTAALALKLRPGGQQEAFSGRGKPRLEEAKPRATQYMLWLALAACGTMLMLATTNYLSQDLAVVPLIWVLPLSLYLLTFVLTFARLRFYRRGLVYPVVAGAFAAATHALFRGGFFPAVAEIWIFSLAMFAGCLFCHGELARRKPAARYLTGFYLSVAAGGALGSLIVALAAPYLFRDLWEMPLALAACALLTVLVLVEDRASWVQRAPGWQVLTAVAVLGSLPLIALNVGMKMSPEWARNSLLLGGAYGAAIVVLFLLRHAPPVQRWAKLSAWTAPAILCVLLYLRMQITHGDLLLRSRNFYGVLSVWETNKQDPVQHAYELYHGRVLHGLQLRNPEYRRRATSYYGNQSGVGLALKYQARRWRTSPDETTLRVGAVGLGSGTIALYAVPGDYFRFYELNPAIVGLSRGTDPVFSYLRDCRGKTEVVAGDARLSLEQEAEKGELQQFDVLVLDAFSGDAIPVHLLTREAFEIYFKHLRDENAILAIHITNRVLNLAPVLAELARELQLNGVRVLTKQRGDYVQETEWVLLSKHSPVLKAAQVTSEIQPLEEQPQVRLWTDDYSNVFSLLK